MTVCNMSIEAGARAGMIAPDETTFEYLHGRALRAKAQQWDAAVAALEARSQPMTGARFDRTISLDAQRSSR